MAPEYAMKRSWLLRIGTASIAASCLLGDIGVLRAQYPGHVDMQQKAAATSNLRAVAVLEWTGDRNHPNATRLVPVSLFDGEHLQDGALYLARPVPLALDSGTEYEVEGSGLPQGWFDIEGAREIGDDWFGFGKWKPYVPPPPKKLHPSRNPPTLVRDKSDDAEKPHFVRRDQSTDGANQNGTANSGSTSAQKTPESTQASSAPVDPDRPRLRRRPEEDKPQQQAASAPESPSAAPDPDRPRLAHGKPADLKDEPKPLEITPVALGQTVAVSDANNVSKESFAYEWGSPADAASAQKELETRAAQLLAATKPADTSPNTASKQTSTTHHSTAHHATVHKTARRTAKPLETPLPLTDVHFSAFAMTYGSGPTLVLTAREASGTHSIAVIALQDIYGKIQVLWHSITDDEHLDVTPRMKLIDAVDPRGDGRANLLFEERNNTDRRFALYVVGADNAEQVFATDPLPLHPVAQPSGG
jgi:hypothetical protein